MAKGVVEDIGEISASASAGLTELSRCHEKNSERDVHGILTKKFCVGIPLSLTELRKSPGVRYSGDFVAIRLRSWIKFMVDFNCWHIFCGLLRPNEAREKAILVEFWRRQRLQEPNHELWSMADSGLIDLSLTAPLVLHGDEGRGRKKSGLLVMTWHSLLGRGTEASNAYRKGRPYLAQKMNFIGNTFSHRLIAAVLPKMFKDEVAFQDILEFLTTDSLDVLTSGVQSCHGTKYHAVCLHLCGDWAFLSKAGSLSRSFSTCEKRPKCEMSVPKGICHLCQAGQNGMPWEDFRLDNGAAWTKTMYCMDPFMERPKLLRLPHVTGQSPQFFAFDLWHCWHLGTGKVFTATVLTIMSDMMPDRSVDSRFERLSDEFLRWCDETRHQPYLTKITKDTCGWTDRGTFPNGMWSKGSLTVTISRFIRDWCQLRDLTGDSLTVRLLRKARDTNACIEDAMTRLYRNDLWLSNSEAKAIGLSGLQFLVGFRELAEMSFANQQALFSYMPKMHVCEHIFRELYFDSGTRQWIRNPLSVSVQADEDMVGRCCRTSRKTNSEQVIRRTLERILLATYKHWRDLGYIMGT